MNVLIIKMGALGDLIMSTPSIRSIIEQHGSDQVWLLTSPGFAQVFEGWPGLQVKTLPRKGWLAMLQTLCWIRSGCFGRLYDLQSSERTALICALSGVPERVGNHPIFAYHFHPADRYTGQCHAQERLKQVLASAGVTPSPTLPYLPISAESKARVSAWLTSNKLADRAFVLMHAGASAKHPQKRWPYFLQLAIELKSAGLETLWLGGKDDHDINTALSAQTGINTTGLFSVQEEAELGRHARFAVANDSAPMHIVACSSIPVFGLFGPTNWRRTHAVGQQKNVIALDTDKVSADPGFIAHAIADISVALVMDKLTSSRLIINPDIRGKK